MVSYHVRSSFLVSVSTKLLRVMSSKIFLLSVMGMLEYMLEMSRDDKEVDSVNGVCRSGFIRLGEFVMLNVLGNGARRLK